MQNPNFTSVDHYQRVYEALRASRTDLTDWCADLRSQAMDALVAEGFPVRRSEDWKYTNARPILQTEWTPAEQARAYTPDPNAVWQQGQACCLTFVDGHYAEVQSHCCSDLEPCMVRSMQHMVGHVPDFIRQHLGTLAPVKGFDALSLAMASDGAVIHVPRGVFMAEHMHVVHDNSGSDQLTALRHLFVLEEGSDAQVTLHFQGTGAYLSNTTIEVLVGRNAKLKLVIIADDSAEAYHVGSLHIRQDAGSEVEVTSLAAGGKTTRIDIHAVLDGDNGSCDLRGLTLGRAKQSIDHHTLVDHAKPNCTSNETFKVILDDKARGVFTGKVVVREGADGTDSAQSNPSLLLSDDAIANTRPQLEIYADDVKCSHGATVGQIDDDALFYLQQRGLSVQDAKRILTYAFAGEVVDFIKHEPVREYLRARVWRWLEEGGY